VVVSRSDAEPWSIYALRKEIIEIVELEITIELCRRSVARKQRKLRAKLEAMLQKHNGRRFIIIPARKNRLCLESAVTGHTDRLSQVSDYRPSFFARDAAAHLTVFH
jgi:hypothetical protein